jgi:CRP-like cAMP-binding protein
MFKGIYDFANAQLGTNFKSNEEFPFTIDTKTFSRNEIITDYGQIERKAYFVKSGIVRAESTNIDGELKILDFITPGYFFAGYISWITQQPSEVSLIVEENCEVEIFYRSEIQKLYPTSLIVNQISRVIAEFKVVQKTTREKDFLTKSAFERYCDFLNKSPDLIDRISNKNLARYLGIQPESLSRLKKNHTS